MSNIEYWKNVAKNVEASFKDKAIGIKPFFGVMDFIHKKDWQGACHAASAILHILFNEQGISSKLYIGECQNGLLAFDHSWIEVDGKVFDSAISNTLIEGVSFSPVYYDIDLNTGNETNTEYGVSTGKGYSRDAQIIKQVPFYDYMSGFPDYKGGLWGMAKDIGSSVGLYLNIGRVKEKYNMTKWNEKI